MRPEDLPIQVTLEWPAGVIQRVEAWSADEAARWLHERGVRAAP